jgi:diguanylate cyclase (GGDEF)-like protein
MIDIDHFKKINDDFGHQTGDEVLVAVANTLSAEVRDSDVIVRFGGEEFLVIAPHTPVENAAGLAERLRAVAAAQIVRTARGSGSVQFTISVGVATFNENARTASALVEAADGNLYRAKNGGRNQVVANGQSAFGHIPAH